jgi:hypothetical protein
VVFDFFGVPSLIMINALVQGFVKLGQESSQCILRAASEVLRASVRELSDSSESRCTFINAFNLRKRAKVNWPVSQVP